MNFDKTIKTIRDKTDYQCDLMIRHEHNMDEHMAQIFRSLENILDYQKKLYLINAKGPKTSQPEDLTDLIDDYGLDTEEIVMRPYNTIGHVFSGTIHLSMVDLKLILCGDTEPYLFTDSEGVYGTSTQVAPTDIVELNGEVYLRHVNTYLKNLHIDCVNVDHLDRIKLQKVAIPDLYNCGYVLDSKCFITDSGDVQFNVAFVVNLGSFAAKNPMINQASIKQMLLNWLKTIWRENWYLRYHTFQPVWYQPDTIYTESVLIASFWKLNDAFDYNIDAFNKRFAKATELTRSMYILRYYGMDYTTTEFPVMRNLNFPNNILSDMDVNKRLNSVTKEEKENVRRVEPLECQTDGELSTEIIRYGNAFTLPESISVQSIHSEVNPFDRTIAFNCNYVDAAALTKRFSNTIAYIAAHDCYLNDPDFTLWKTKYQVSYEIYLDSERFTDNCGVGTIRLKF